MNYDNDNGNDNDNDNDIAPKDWWRSLAWAPPYASACPPTPDPPVSQVKEYRKNS